VSPGDALVERLGLTRAGFLAASFGVVGLVQFGLALADGLASLDAVSALMGFGFAAIGVVYLRFPESIRRGTEPAPARWYELAAVVVGALALAGLAAAALGAR
jgi:hypothetical protein